MAKPKQSWASQHGLGESEFVNVEYNGKQYMVLNRLQNQSRENNVRMPIYDYPYLINPHSL